jgi:hypothetical protein
MSKIPFIPFLTLTVAAGASLWSGSRFAASTATAWTIVHDADIHLLVHAPGGLLEGQVHLVLLRAKIELLLLARLAKISKRATSSITKDCPKIFKHQKTMFRIRIRLDLDWSPRS